MASAVIASSRRPAYRWAVFTYDRLYRLLHGLDRPAAQVGAALRIEVRVNRRARALPGGVAIGPGDRVGLLHLNNDQVARLHLDGLSPLAVGLQFRRHLVVSLRALAGLAAGGGPLGPVRAFAAVTIFHQGLARLGFVAEPRGLRCPGLVAAYQRALLASLHPAGQLRLTRALYPDARRLWLPREVLLARYGADAPARLRPAAGGG